MSRSPTRLRLFSSAAVFVATLLGHPASAQSAVDPAGIPAPELDAGSERSLVQGPPVGASAVARAVRISERPQIDGILDEPFWATLPPTTTFVQRDPVEGGVPTERTEMRIAYDDENLYFGFILHDSEPSAIVGNNLHRGGSNGYDDHLVIGLDTFNDRRNGYIFEINALGTQDDAIFTDERLGDWNWDGVYYSEGRMTAQGWTMEVAIPFTTIRFPRASEIPMGLLVNRMIRRKNESVFWPHLPATYRGHYAQASQYGTLLGIEGISPGRNVQIKPFAIGGGQAAGSGVSAERVLDAGVDVKYAPTSSLTLDLTYNTDFAQVEADNVQINLDRFSLFFPEKREFFLERSGLFEFGDPGETQVFFSRRIGLESPILGGGRLTGQLGRFTVGLLDLQTEDAAEIAGANNAVGRMRVDLGQRASAGGIFTNVEREEGWSRAAGADAQFRFLGSSSLDVWATRLWDSDPVDGADDVGPLDGQAAGAASLSLRDATYGLGLGYTNIGAHFLPAVGFVQRRDLVRWNGELAFTPRFDASRWARQFNFFVRGNEIVGQDGRRQSATQLLDGFLALQSGAGVGTTVTRRFERLETPFQIRPGTVLAPGDHTFTNARVLVRSNPAAMVNGSMNFTFGEYYGGTRTEARGGVGFTPSKHLNFAANLNHNRIDLPTENGEFTATIVDLRVKAAVNRDLFADLLLQYDDVSREVQSNLRINWIHKPGSNLYLVLDSGYLTGDVLDPAVSRWSRRTGVAKLTYLWAV